MRNLTDLRLERGRLVEQMKAILDTADKAKRDLTAEERQEYDKLDVAQEALGETVRREERLADLERQLKVPVPLKAAGKDLTPPTDHRVVVASPEYAEAFQAYLIGGIEALDLDQRATLKAGWRATEGRALSVGTTTAGGFTVPQGFSGQLEDSLLAFGGMVVAATVFETDSGQDLPWPTSDDTTNAGALLAENTADAEQDVVFGQIIFKAYKYTSKIIRVSQELLQDSAFNISEFLARKFAERIGRITNTHFTTGTGTAQPQGVVTASSVGKTGATGQTTSVIYDDLVDMEHSIDPAYRVQPGVGWMMHDSSLKVIKKLKDTQNRPLWQPGLVARQADTILGYPFFINQDVAVMAASAKSILFGALKKYMIRRVREITVIRLVERYAEFYQVGYLAFARMDGRMLDAGTDPVKNYTNSAT